MVKALNRPEESQGAHVLTSGNCEHLRPSALDAAALRERLTNAGIRISVDGDRLTAGPSSLLTDGLRAEIRRHRDLLVKSVTTPCAAVDLLHLAPAALQLGSLVICENCKLFELIPGSVPDGWCTRHRAAAWGRVAFDCPDYMPVSRPDGDADGGQW